MSGGKLGLSNGWQRATKELSNDGGFADVERAVVPLTEVTLENEYWQGREQVTEEVKIALVEGSTMRRGRREQERQRDGIPSNKGCTECGHVMFGGGLERRRQPPSGKVKFEETQDPTKIGLFNGVDWVITQPPTATRPPPPVSKV